MKPEDAREKIDPRLAAAYEAVRDEPVGDVDWDRLRRTIAARAAPVLRRRKLRRRYRAVPRSAVPLALAAGIAFALWIGPRALMESPTADPAAPVFAIDINDEAALLEALVADLTEQEFEMLVTGHADPDAVLAVAVSGP